MKSLKIAFIFDDSGCMKFGDTFWEIFSYQEDKSVKWIDLFFADKKRFIDDFNKRKWSEETVSFFSDCQKELDVIKK